LDESPERHSLGYQNLTAPQLAARLHVPASWILQNANAVSCADPIPHLSLGKYKRFRWNSPKLNAWIYRHLVAHSGSCAKVSRTGVQLEYLDSAELARRLNVPESWVRDQVRTRALDPIPHVRFGKYVRFLWQSPELECWAESRMLGGHNTGVNRAPRKETIQ
jgi:hypothetical protein